MPLVHEFSIILTLKISLV